MGFFFLFALRQQQEQEKHSGNRHKAAVKIDWAVITGLGRLGIRWLHSLSIGAMLQTGLTVQALLLQDYYGRDEEVLCYAMLVVFCVAAALILVPLFMGFFRESVDDTPPVF